MHQHLGDVEALFDALVLATSSPSIVVPEIRITSSFPSGSSPAIRNTSFAGRDANSG
jgi:hypothetical protein